MKDGDIQKFTEIQGKHIAFSITSNKLIIVPTSFRMETFIIESRDIDQCQCQRLLNKEIKEIIKTAQTQSYLILFVMPYLNFNKLIFLLYDI